MANDRADFAPEILHEKFEYRDGQLYRKTGQFAGLAGTQHHSGYWQVKIGKKSIFAHRIVYAMHHGYMPEQIDHIDGNKLNNRIENLRECSNQTNQYNVGLNIKNTSGVKNVVRDRNKWAVFMRINKKMTRIGSFLDKEFATFVAEEARNKYHGEFAHHG